MTDTKVLPQRIPQAGHFVTKLNAYQEVALVLQGGGALGSYQAGVYQGLSEAGVEPHWIAGISIGALNCAIIAGNPPENRVEALRGFWESICRPQGVLGDLANIGKFPFGVDELIRKSQSAYAACQAIVYGQKGFFTPRLSHPLIGVHKTPDEISYYHTNLLKKTLLEYTDFDLINKSKMRVSIGAVNVRTGNFIYFDNSKIKLTAEHFMASGALPPGFPAIEIDGEYYWDGGLVSNTPLSEVLNQRRNKDTLVFQVDLWSAHGILPKDMMGVAERMKDIQYSSRTRAVTNLLSEYQEQAELLRELLQLVPKKERQSNPWCKHAEMVASLGRVNVIHLIYANKTYEGHYKDYEFSTESLGEHWASGLEDIRQTFKHPAWLSLPTSHRGFSTHDIHRTRKTTEQKPPL